MNFFSSGEKGTVTTVKFTFIYKVLTFGKINKISDYYQTRHKKTLQISLTAYFTIYVIIILDFSTFAHF